MSDYNNIYISRETFEMFRNEGISYTGFVIGEGYVFVQYQVCSQLMSETIIQRNGENVTVDELSRWNYYLG